MYGDPMPARFSARLPRSGYTRGCREVFDRRFDPGLPKTDLSPFAAGLSFPPQLFGIHVSGDSEIRRGQGQLARDQTPVALSSLAPRRVRSGPVTKTKAGAAPGIVDEVDAVGNGDLVDVVLVHFSGKPA